MRGVHSHYATVDPLTSLPRILQAGDAYVIDLTLSSYPASAGWTAQYAVRGATTQDWTSAPVGDTHRLTLSAESTGQLSAGANQFALRMTNGSSVVTAQSGVVEVRANVLNLAAGEGQSWAEKTLAVVEAVLNNTATGEMKMYMIGGRQVQTHSLKELMALRSQLQAEVQAAKGMGFGTPMRFTVVGLR